jgi:hypothetical protein
MCSETERRPDGTVCIRGRCAPVPGVPTLARHRSLPRTSAAPLCLTSVEDDGDLFIRRKTLTQLIAELGTVSTDDNEPTA